MGDNILISQFDFGGFYELPLKVVLEEEEEEEVFDEINELPQVSTKPLKINTF